MIGFSLVALISLLVATPGDGSAAIPEETFIPDVASDGIHDWQPHGDQGLYIQSIAGNWYFARTQGRCARLRTAVSLGFVTHGPDHLDRNGAIIAEGWRCQLSSLTRSAPPQRGS
jgi:hypothetical protein